MENKGNLDVILSFLGKFGKWQISQCILLTILYFSCANHFMAIVLIGFVPKFRCRTLLDDGNFTSLYSNSSDVFDQQCSVINATSNTTSPCADGYIYAEPKHSSIVSEWDLVCGHSVLAEASQTALEVGFTLGSIIFPAISDRFGRKRTYMITHLVYFLTAIATAFVPNIIVFMIFRAILGAFLVGAAIVGYVMIMELYPPQYRTVFVAVGNVFWGCCTCYVAGLGHLMRGQSWRHLQLAFAASSFVIIFQQLFLDDSIRWLIANGKRKQAVKIIRRAGKVNNVCLRKLNELIAENIPSSQEDKLTSPQLKSTNDGCEDLPLRPLLGNITAPETLIDVHADVNSTNRYHHAESNIANGLKVETPAENSWPNESYTVSKQSGEHRRMAQEEEVTKYTFLDIFRHRRLRFLMCIFCFAWFTNSVTYYGLFMLSSVMAGDRYLNLFAQAVVEIPAAASVPFLLHKFGRRRSCIGFHALCAMALLLAMILHFTTEGRVAEVVVRAAVIAGKFCITGSFCVIYQYTPEIFPTNMRASGIGIASVAARFGGYIAPFSATVGRILPWMPGAVFGGCCLIVSLLCLLLPETSNKELPQTLEDLDRLILEDKQRKLENEKA